MQDEFRRPSKMDIYKLIRELHAEKVRLDNVIALLEELQKRSESLPEPSDGRRRGGESMKSADGE
jgi:hypothetical protein